MFGCFSSEVGLLTLVVFVYSYCCAFYDHKRGIKETKTTRKSFFRKTNICVYKKHSIHTRLLYIHITKPVLFLVLASSAMTLKKSHIVSCQEASAKIRNVCIKANNSSPTELSLPNYT